MGCPDMCVLFADSFAHPEVGDHVDEVRENCKTIRWLVLLFLS